MNFAQAFKLALKSLRTSKMRAFLTMLGIIIGVGAVIVILALGNGMTNLMNAEFETMGVNVVQVFTNARGSGGTRVVEIEDLYALVEKYPQYLNGVTPYINTSAKVRQGTEEFKRSKVYGVSEAFFKGDTLATMQGEKIEQGRFLSYVEVSRHQNVCVIGKYLDETAFRGEALGQSMSLDGVPYTVIGVLEKRGDGSEGSADDVLYIPYKNAQRMSSGGGIMNATGANMFLMTATSRENAAAAKGIVEKQLNKIYKSPDFYMVMTSAELMDAMNTLMDTLMVVLVTIAAISLVVGGIGIMNIMLVSVTERTREIGIRKSLGAKQRDIRGQFLIEAGTTSAVGGSLGIAFGLFLARVASVIFSAALGSGSGKFSAVPTAGDIAVSFCVSVGIGVLFGYLPANKAARLNPIDALRYD